MPTKTAEPKAEAQIYYLRFLADGLTLNNDVWRAGAVCATKEAVGALSERQQRDRWGVAYFEQITQEEFDGLREVKGTFIEDRRAARPSPAYPSMKTDLGTEMDTPPIIEGAGIQTVPPAPPIEEALAALGDAANPYPWYDKANAVQTLALVGDMGEAEVAEFLVWERTHKSRTGVIEMIEKGETSVKDDG